ncbi:hypothetical protein FQR65_LT08720 [Abscondita terminalis]|nr:hypothetical protein FQR65_LT08720 [Abscondita terminalis]
MGNKEFGDRINCTMPYIFILIGLLLTLYWKNVILLSTLNLLFCGLSVIFVIGPLIYRSSYRIQRSTIFLNYISIPPSPHYANPSKCGLRGALNFYLTTDENIKLGVWHIVPENLITESTDKDSNYYTALLENGPDIIIYNHGNAGNRSAPHRLELYEVLRKNYQIIAFDYRGNLGYGDSSNVEPSEMGAVRDSMYVYTWVRGLSKRKVYIWGHSLGTSISTHMLSLLPDDMTPDGLILESPFNNMRDEIGKHPFATLFRSLPWFNYAIIDPVYNNNLKFETDQYIRKVNCPIMILHAKDDIIVPYNLGLQLYEGAQQSRRPTQGPLRFHSFERSCGYGHKYICRAPDLNALLNNFTDHCNEIKSGSSAS